MEELVMDSLWTFFQSEIANQVSREKNKITVCLADGTKAVIEIKSQL